MLLTPTSRFTCCSLQGTGMLSTQYWLGLSYNSTTNKWMWQEGGDAGNGAVSNANPYAHWAYDFQDITTRNPTWTCVSGYVYRDYDQVRPVLRCRPMSMRAA